MSTRRQFLAASSALFASWGLGGCREVSLANFSEGARERKFIFITATGGWDTTRVFAPVFDNAANVDLEATSNPQTIGGITYVSNPLRPSVDNFFQAHHQRSLIVNGILVPSLAHEVCTKLMLTGTTADAHADIPAIMAARVANQHALPHIVLNGPSFPGEFGTVVTRTGSGGQLDALLSGGITFQSDQPVNGFSPRVRNLISEKVRERAQERELRASAQLKKLQETYSSALDRAQALKELNMRWSGGAGFQQRLSLAVDALSRGVSRCVSVAHQEGFGWDTHSGNDDGQNFLFEDLFAGLSALMERLTEANLLEDTLVVVLSEMGRTPKLNGAAGKDHWPYTSALLLGSGITGDRVVGGYDQLFNGQTLDFKSGDIHDGGQALGSNSFCATLLNLAGVDHKSFFPGVASLPTLIA
jgi:uncharacterized protein (DUF1501 family)